MKHCSVKVQVYRNADRYAIKQSEQGVKVEETRRKMGISGPTCYTWKRKFGGLGISELREWRLLKKEHSKFKQIVADLSLDRHMLQEVITRKL